MTHRCLAAQRFKASEVMSCEVVNTVPHQSLFGNGEVYFSREDELKASSSKP